MTHLTSGAASTDIYKTAVRKRSVKLLPAVKTRAAPRLSANRCRCCPMHPFTATQWWLRKDKDKAICDKQINWPCFIFNSFDFVLTLVLIKRMQPLVLSYPSPVFSRALMIRPWLQLCTMASSARLTYCWIKVFVELTVSAARLGLFPVPPGPWPSAGAQLRCS